MDEFGMDSDDGQYAHGIAWGISASRRQAPLMTPEEAKHHSLRTVAGFFDALALIAKVLAYGDAPSGEYLDLLAAPHGDPLAQP